MRYDDTIVLVFAKAPVAGQVNTRLIPDIGEQAATRLQHDLINDRLNMLTASELCHVRLMCAPDAHHECFRSCEQRYPIELSVQRGDDLGERMFDAASTALHEYRYCIIIGTDAPALDTGTITQAIEGLRSGKQAVFVPAEDGGYVLLGLSEAREELFRDISWGSAQVMQQTRRRLQENAIDYLELDTCWDIDVVEDYTRYLIDKSK
jgi:rSAM/selenodomain-associated transferase 1